MGQKIGYWGSTAIVAGLMTLSSLLYLSGAEKAATAFTHLGYPQHLRIILGLAKLSGVIVLLMPGLARLKEWAYAGFTFTWTIAAVAHYLAGDGLEAIAPLVLLGLLAVSYRTRPADRRLA